MYSRGERAHAQINLTCDLESKSEPGWQRAMAITAPSAAMFLLQGQQGEHDFREEPPPSTPSELPTPHYYISQDQSKHGMLQKLCTEGSFLSLSLSLTLAPSPSLLLSLPLRLSFCLSFSFFKQGK